MESSAPQGIAVRTVLFLLAHARRKGVPESAMFQGIPEAEQQLKDLLGKLDWNLYFQILERLQQALGGPWPLEELLRSLVGDADTVAPMDSNRISAAQFYGGLLPQALRTIHMGLHVEYDTMPGGTIRTVVSIPDAHQPSLPFMHAWVGIHRGATRSLGLPSAMVEGEFTGRRGVFLITLPPQVKPPRKSRTLRSANRFSPFLAADGPDVAMSSCADPAGEQTLAETACKLGERLLGSGSLANLAGALKEILTAQGVSRGLWLWAVGQDDETLELAQEGTLDDRAPRYLCPLTLDGQEVGRLLLDLPPWGTGSGRRWLAAMLPWITLAVDKCRVTTAEQASPTSFPQHAEDLWRLDGAVAAWQLTPRQAEVLQLVVRGCSNKEIGTRLGTSIKTVELHVTQLLRKTNTENRAALIARFWSADLEGEAKTVAETSAPAEEEEPALE